MMVGMDACGSGGAPPPAVTPCGRKKSAGLGCQDPAAILRSGSGASSPANAGLTAIAEHDKDLGRNTGAGSLPEEEEALRLMTIRSKLLVFLRTLSGFLRWAALRAAAFSASEGTVTEVVFLLPTDTSVHVSCTQQVPLSPNVPRSEAAQIRRCGGHISGLPASFIAAEVCMDSAGVPSFLTRPCSFSSSMSSSPGCHMSCTSCHKL